MIGHSDDMSRLAHAPYHMYMGFTTMCIRCRLFCANFSFRALNLKAAKKLADDQKNKLFCKVLFGSYMCKLLRLLYNFKARQIWRVFFLITFYKHEF